MARFETLVPSAEAGLFDSALWDFVARMLGCSVPVHVVHRYPHQVGGRWVIEMDGAERLEELASEAQRNRTTAECRPMADPDPTTYKA